MPLDPSIILGAQPAPLQSPLQAISAIAQLQDVRAQTEQRRQAGAAARQKAMDDAQVRSVFAAAGGDTDAALKQLYTVNPRAAAPLAEQVGKARKEQLDAMGKDLTNQKLRAELALQIGQTVNDGPSYGLARPAMVATSPVLDTILPPADAPWDPNRWSQIMQAGVSGKDLLEHKQKVVDLFANGKVNEAVGTALSNLNPADPTAGAQATKYLEGAKALGAPEVILAPYRALLTPDGAWAPDASARAAALTISPAKHAELAKQGSTDEAAKVQYRDITVRQQLGQPVTPVEAAWAKAYEKDKTLTTDVSAGAAMDRQTRTIAAQVAQQQRAQTFTQLQAARQDIRENVDKPYAIAQSGADTLRDTVHAAMGGNKLAGSLQNLEATMGALRAQGFNRINAAEIGATGNAGSLWDNISGYLGKKLEGQPVPADVQKDMLAFADILDQAAAKKYAASHDAVNKLYGTTIPRTYNVPTGGANAAAAPSEGTTGVVNGVPAVWKTVNGKAGWYKQ